MLFSVLYVRDSIEEFQDVIVYFFRELESNNHKEFSENLFPEASRSKLYKYGNSDNGFKKFVESFQDIFQIYNDDSLTADVKKKIIDDFFQCNKIDEICDNLECCPIHFDDMGEEEKKIARHFNLFYDSYFNDFTDKTDHFDKFIYENGKICSVCGLETIYQYDHYIPKGTVNPVYPFSSVNPKNLLPICQGCNGPKSSKLIFYLNNDRHNVRLVSFSPYSDFETWENLNYQLINISKPTVNSSGKWKVSFTANDSKNLSDSNLRKIDRWKEFYNIEDRFSKEIERNLKIWIEEFKMKGKTLDEMISDTQPNKVNIRRINGIIIQNLIYSFINENAELQNLLTENKSVAVNPFDLLFEQEGSD